MVVDATRADELDWVQLRKDMDYSLPTETMTQKAKRKFVENPLIPIGCMATVAALSTGIHAFLKGYSWRSQYMMRTRVVAQGCTIVAVLISLGSQHSKSE